MSRFSRDWPIRWQLSALYVGLLVIILGALGALLYVQIQNFLIVDAADRLATQVSQTAGRALPDLPVIEKKLGAPALPSTGDLLRKAGSLIVNDIEAKGTYVEVYDLSGTAMAESQTPLPPLPWPAISPRAVDSVLRGKKSYVAPVGPQQPGALRVVVPLTAGTSPVGYVVISYVPLGVSSLLDALRTYLLLGVVLAALAGIGVGVPLTRRILRPLDRMAETAGAIAAGDLEQRVGLEGRNEIGRLGAAFDRMVAQLGAVLQAQRQFVADASHELRTPITALSGTAEMLLVGADRGDPAARQRLLHQIQTEVGRMSRLVSDLLALSQLDAAPRLERAPVDLAALACRVFEAAQPLHADRVLLPPSGAAAVIVSGDADRLRQVLLNLLDNAVKYTGAGGRIQCTCRAEGDWAVLTLLDDGEGIPAPALSHIFDRFYRVDKARARRVGGFGLGLAIVRSIVEAHGGAISAASEGPGAGSSFIVRLPLSSKPLPA